MRKPMLILLTLTTLIPAIAHSGTTNHLLHPDAGPSSRIVGVHFVTDGATPAKRHLGFGSEGGQIDLSSGVLEGRTEQGTGITIPLDQVTRVRIRLESTGLSREYDASIDALVAGSNWPPPGRIRKVLMTSGVSVDFDLVGPGLDLEEKTLFWSCKGDASTSIPFEEIALVQINSNSYVTDFNDLAKFGTPGEVELESGEVVSVPGRSGKLDLEAGSVHCNGDTIPLASVRRILVVDCRGRKDAAPVAVSENSRPAGEGGVKAIDFENLDLSGERVRLHEYGAGWIWIEGRVVAQDSEGLEILVDEETVSVPLEKIDKLKISRGKASNASTGALVGGGLVGITGLALGIAMASDDFFDTTGADVAAATFVGFGIGAVIGGAIGSAIKTEKWDDVDKVELDVFVAPDGNAGIALSWEF